MKDVSPILEQHERLVFEVAYRLGAEENDDAINAACEAIQVAAMCKKFLEMEGKHEAL